MSQNEIHNIDELLNGFLDGELDARHQTEVQRLIKNDEKIAQRLLELQKCKRLVSSLPYNQAPRELVGNIKASLQGKKLTTSQVPPMQRYRVHEVRWGTPNGGARHLLLRRLAAAAAMFALVAVLAAVIYSVIAPVPVVEKPVVVRQPQPIVPQPPAVTVAAVEKPVEPALAGAQFTGQLELKTTSSSEVAAFLNKAIEFNIPSDQRASTAPARPQEAFTLNCSRQNLKVLLDELGTVWDKIDSAALLVNTDSPEGQIVIDAVTPAQIIEIAKQDNFQTQIKTARFFAAMNNIAERSPGKDVMVAIDNSAPALLTIPKPVLTSSEKPVTKVADGTEAEQKVLLTIVVTGGK